MATHQRRTCASATSIAPESHRLNEDALREHVQRVVDRFPPLSAAQLDRLAVLLRHA